MRGSKRKLQKHSGVLAVFALVISSLYATATPSAIAVTPAPPGNLVMCKSLKTSYQYISTTGTCNNKIYETITWYKKGSAPTGTPGSKLISLNTCQSNTTFGALVLKAKCNIKTETTLFWQRPLGPPAAPTIKSVLPGKLGTAEIEYIAPENNGGARVLSYKALSNPGGFTATIQKESSGKIIVSGLHPGTKYTFIVLATNSVGTSLASSSSLEMLAPTTANAPIIKSVVISGPDDAIITFTAPDFDGGTPITDYEVIAHPYADITHYVTGAGIIELTGLAPGTEYTFTLIACNSAGDSEQSNTSNVVRTPVPVPAPEPEPVLVPSGGGTPSLTTQVITWAPGTSLTMAQSPKTPSTLASGFGSPVITYAVTSAGTTGCTVDASTAVITYTSAGSCTVTATAAATSVYASATKSVVFSIAQIEQAVSITSTAPLAAKVAGSTYALTATGGASGNPVTFASLTNSICTVSGSTVSFIGVGTCTLSADQAGNTIYSASPQVTQSFEVTETVVLGNIMTSLVTAPVKAVAKNVSAVDSTGYTGTVAWFESDGTTSAPSIFLASTVYIAKVTLTAKTGYTLTGTTDSFTYAGATSTTYSGGVVTITFPTTAALSTQTVTWAPTTALLLPSSPATPSTTASTDGGGAITYSYVSKTATSCSVDSSTGVLTFSGTGNCVIRASAAATNTYAAGTKDVTFTFTKGSQTITFTQPIGFIVGEADQSTTVSSTSGLNVTLTSTTLSICTIVDAKIHPVSEGTCSITASQTGDASYNAASNVIKTLWIYGATHTVTFNGNGNDGGTMAPQTAVTNSNDAFTANGFTRAGYRFVGWTTASNGNPPVYPDGAHYLFNYDMTIYAQWLAAAIVGVTAPVTGATPVSTVTATVEYTGNVTWSGSPSTFAGSTAYTATITLTAKSGYTLTGVTSNFFTVTGATSVTHNAGSGVVTAVFPATAAPVYNIGDTGPGGGIVFYKDLTTGFNCGAAFSNTGSPTGGLCHYLEVAPNTWSGGSSDPRFLWSTDNSDTSIENETTENFSASAIGLGFKNTQTLDGLYGSTAVADNAVAYHGGALSDWYVPTLTELNLLCQWARGVTQDVSTRCTGGTLTMGGFLDDLVYWSSSEYNGAYAWAQWFSNGQTYAQNRNHLTFGLRYLRPIRSF